MKRSDPGYMREYAKKNKEKLKLYNSEYYSRNRDKLLLLASENQKKNRVRRNKYCSDWGKNNRNKTKEYTRRYREKNKELVRGLDKHQKIKDAEKIKVRKATLFKKHVDNLSDFYIKNNLKKRGFHKWATTIPAIIEIKRINLKIKRYVKNKEKSGKEYSGVKI